MGLLIGTRRALLAGRGVATYAEKVLSYGPTVCWPYWEAGGLTIHEIINGWDNGPPPAGKGFLNVTLGQPGIGDGNTCPWFDGVTGAGNPSTANLFNAFDGANGSIMAWIKVANAGVWTDGALRRVMLWKSATENLMLEKDVPNNTLAVEYLAGGVWRGVSTAAYALTTWIHLAATWSDTNDQLYLYVNGNQIGPTVGIGSWITTINDMSFGVIAAKWHGWLAWGAMWTRVLSAPEVADLATV